MTMTGPAATSGATATAPTFTVNTPPPVSGPPMHFDAGTWIRIIGVVIAAVLVMVGGGVWMHGNLDKRIDRLEGRYDAAHAETTRTLSDIRVQIATLAATKEPPATQSPR